MDIIYMIVIGFVIGLLARFLAPGRDSMGFLLTTVLGIAGAILGGMLGRAFGLYAQGEPAGFLLSVFGAVVLLLLVKAVSRRRLA